MGNFSGDTFDKLKHYVGVRLQQGVPLVDADWNEQEDIRRYELQAFLKWFVGNGVPEGNDGFRILPVTDGTANDFVIKGGDGTPEGAGRCLVEGWDVINERNLRYTDQPLFENDILAGEWSVKPVQPLTTPTVARLDTVYLDVWEREVGAAEDDNLVNSVIDLETCVRLKREWVVRVAEGAKVNELHTPSEGHVYYPLATLTRQRNDITDLRRTDVNVTALADEIEDARGTISALEDEIADARGIKGNLGNRLDESLTKGGQLRHNVVGNDQIVTALADEIEDARGTISTLEDEIEDARGIKGNMGNRLDESLAKGGQLRHNVVGGDQIGDGAVSIANLSTTLVLDASTSVEGTDEGPGVSVINIQEADEHAFYLISVRFADPDPAPQPPSHIPSRISPKYSFNWKRIGTIYRKGRRWQHIHQLVIENPYTFSITVFYKVYRLDER